MATPGESAAAFLRASRASVGGAPSADSTQLRALLAAAVAECSSREQTREVVETLLSDVEARGLIDGADEEAKWKTIVEELRTMANAEAKARFGGNEEEARESIEESERHDSHAASNTTATYGADIAQPSVPVLEHPTATRSFRESLGSRRLIQRLGSNASASGNESGRDSFASDPGDATGKKRRLQRTNTDDKGIPLLQRSSSVSDAVPSLLRSISSIVGVGMEETFLCQICFEHAPVSTSVELRSCGHRFCLTCFKMYLELKIADGQVYPVCFHETEETTTRESSNMEQVRRKTCGVAVLPSDIELIISPEVLKKYETFRFNKENEYGRQCPFCHTSQVCQGPEQPECQCVACEKAFCFTHGNAHVDGTCADYELKQAESDKINRSAIAEISKPCPGCKSNVEKNGGCNHMKCIVCQTDFCWICGAVVESSTTPTHFQWWNLRGCAGQQMDDVDAQTPAQRVVMSIFRFGFLIILGPPALALTLVFTLVSCCCLPCMKAFDTSFVNCFTACLNFMAMALFLLILGLAMALAFVGGMIFQFLMWPFKLIYSMCCNRSRSKPEKSGSDPLADLESGEHTAVSTTRNSV